MDDCMRGQRKAVESRRNPGFWAGRWLVNCVPSVKTRKSRRKRSLVINFRQIKKIIFFSYHNKSCYITPQLFPKFYILFIYISVYLFLRIELKALCEISMCSITEVHPVLYFSRSIWPLLNTVVSGIGKAMHWELEANWVFSGLTIYSHIYWIFFSMPHTILDADVVV